MGRQVSIKGREDVKRALANFPKKLQSKVLRTAVREGAKEFAKEVKLESPVSTGAMKRSVKVRSGKRRKNYISSNVVVTGGHPEDVPAFVEYGTQKMEANPFVLRGFEHKEVEVKTKLMDDILEAVKKQGWL